MPLLDSFCKLQKSLWKISLNISLNNIFSDTMNYLATDKIFKPIFQGIYIYK